MKRLGWVKGALMFFIIFLVFAVGITLASSVLLTWVAPTTNTDGSPLTDLAGYKVYYGENAGGPYPMELDVGSTLSVNIEDQTWEGKEICFVATAYDAFGNESVYSNEVCKTYPLLAPAPPTLSIQ